MSDNPYQLSTATLDPKELDGKVLHMVYTEGEDDTYVVWGHDRQENKMYLMMDGKREVSR